ncbi:S-layer homology domain-containing protein [Egicoccus halophilus]|uniref:SLH domain-containing protein n=1 Tax=Egicoccus halophilus TaxID=1670830 RepID=A0A8J3A7V4_9ACTN|nr:S-layer homology domain-containing protein [Egicoccus halophilus]GGI05937.1 hypothetical protein GCM10011354_16600 [Egicoccus halophilus]
MYRALPVRRARRRGTIRHLTGGLAALVALVLAAGVLAPSAALAQDRPDLAGRFVDSVNAERVKRGLPRLQVAGDLTQVARRHSVRMADQNRLHHNPNLSTDVRNWQRLSENVGRGRSATSLHTAFMNSDGHRRNIVDDRVSQIGVGVEVRGNNVWVTKVFRRPTSAATTSPTTRFHDVGATSPHATPIGRLTASGVTSGCRTDRFCPGSQVTRGQIASFIGRAKGVLPADSGPYRDLASTATHAGNINGTTAASITTGCTTDRFCADRALTRAEMAEFLGRALGLRPAALRSFADVDPAHPQAGWIQALADAGVTSGCTSGTYCPEATVTRAQMASFLVRAFRL